MSNILNSKDFGLKIYNRFPPKYREDDVSQNYALKRYLEALADGGFKYAIDEINGILDIKDPDKTKAEVLPILFKQYGLEIFNGIPEEYLRYLLPKLGEAWSMKGSLSVVEFITSSLSGVKTTTDIIYDEDDNPNIDVRFEMDYNIGDYFPDAEQFKKLLVSLLPFYCDTTLIYNYMFYIEALLKIKEEERIKIFEKAREDLCNILGEDTINTSIVNNVSDSVSVDCESTYHDKVNMSDGHEQKTIKVEEELDTKFRQDYEESTRINSKNIDRPEAVAVLAHATVGVSILAYYEDQADAYLDIIVDRKDETVNLLPFVDSKTNSGYNVLNSNFYTNGMHSYDIITIGNEQTIIIH